MLQAEYIALMGEGKLRSLADPSRGGEGVNAFLQYMGEERCRYMLSSRFECCGMPVSLSDYMNFSNFVFSAMSEAVSRAEECGLANFDAQVLVGLSPYSDFGAEVMRVDSGYLVLISPVTLSFCMVYSILAVSSMQAIAQLAPGLLDELSRGQLEKLESDSCVAGALTSLRTLNEMVEEFAVTRTLRDPVGLVASSGFGNLHPIYHERVQAVYEHFITFLVLHEFAHIDLGHMGAENKVMRSVPLGDKEYAMLDPLPLQEEQADDYALRALVGTKFRDELLPLFEILAQGDANHKELNKLWAGHTAYGRYVSALLLMRGFDLMDSYYLRDSGSGIAFTNNCEINGSHPSGQHRFIRAWAKIQDLIPLPEVGGVNADSILNWSNFITVVSMQRKEERDEGSA